MTTAALPGPSTGAPAVTRLLDPAPQPGPPPFLDGARLAAELAAAGLTGRGGAGFPTARKLGVLLGSRATGVVVVGNGMEGEPLSHKDAVLLATAPDVVLDGLRVVADALGASRVVLAVGARTRTAAVVRAVDARHGVGHDRVPVELMMLPDGFVTGQETAVVNAIEGRRAVPRDRAVPLWERGVDRRPTLILNVETLAHVALVARHGAAWWRTTGTPEEPGTTLVTVSGSSAAVVRTPGVLEVARGTSLRLALARAGTDVDRTRAVLVGGFHGAWVPVEALGVGLSRRALSRYGATPGAGVLHVLDRHDCPLEVVARITGYLAGQGAGQCGPCVNGLPALASTLAGLAAPGARGAGPAVPARVRQLADVVDGRGACAHPDGTARLVRSTLAVFADHVAAHLDGRCPR